MSPQELEKLIQQHGEAAKAYENEAVQIGYTYIIPNFGFDAVMQNTLDLLLAPRKDWNHGVVDIRVFTKPHDYIPFDSNEETTEIEIIDFCSLIRNIYPHEYPYYELPEWWTEEDMQAAAEVLDPLDFAIWIQDTFRPDESEEEILDMWLKSVQPYLGEEVLFYKMEDDNNSNCGFAPYLFVGDRCLILVVRCWQL
ncbi:MULTISPECIES: hypothetical protein [Nostocales]|uniref:Uncharacterized protein n=3 Tax=Nostocales TaxID=1161 RepID=A0A0C1R493_9CYAN|nr:hypothetical protein [Tolypothrix bouteillei]KAF3889438.1 hypothetical protein DA73_0400031115 [Tolypothrix bouteillei VB521301]